MFSAVRTAAARSTVVVTLPRSCSSLSLSSSSIAAAAAASIALPRSPLVVDAASTPARRAVSSLAASAPSTAASAAASARGRTAMTGATSTTATALPTASPPVLVHGHLVFVPLGRAATASLQQQQQQQPRRGFSSLASRFMAPRKPPPPPGSGKGSKTDLPGFLVLGPTPDPKKHKLPTPMSTSEARDLVAASPKVLLMARRAPFCGLGVRWHLPSSHAFVAAVRKNAVNGVALMGVFALKDSDAVPFVADETEWLYQVKDADKIHKVGALLRVAIVHDESDDSPVILHANFTWSRVSLQNVVSVRPWQGTVSLHPDFPVDAQDPSIQANTTMLFEYFQRYLESGQSILRELLMGEHSRMPSNTAPSIIGYMALSVINPPLKVFQTVFQEPDFAFRTVSIAYLVRDAIAQMETARNLQQKMQEKQSTMMRRQAMLESMRMLKQELGENKDAGLVEKYRKRLAGKRVPVEALTIIHEQISKLLSEDDHPSELSTARAYLDWLTCLPWGIATPERIDIAEAARILDAEHYGMKEVKDRILEFVSVSSLRDRNVSGKILCLVGPPGVGKTSIAKSIANALNRKYHRISLGGVHDVSEIKGHRRTYVAALPGRIVAALKAVQVENPLIVLDEIDKLGQRGMHGDPGSALLELLDPEQNRNFLDHYLDVPLDMSKTMFVCTANSLSTISAPLLNRMEVVELSGYVFEEKLAIAKQYILPKARREAGLLDAGVTITDEALAELVNCYSRENGVRELQRNIEKVYNKAAFNIKSLLDAGGASGSQSSTSATSVGGSASALSAAAGESYPPPRRSVAAVASTSWMAQSAALDSVSRSDLPSEGTAMLSRRGGAGKTPTVDISEIPEFSPEESVKRQQQYEVEQQLRAKDHAEFLRQRMSKLPAIVITPENLADFIGPARFDRLETLFEVNPVGVVTGLAYTEMGGAALPMEAVVTRIHEESGKSSLVVTGQLGDVMSESTKVAHSFAKSFMVRHFPSNTALQRSDIHLHAPSGAIKKDGPSAGIVLASMLLSIALDTPVPSKFALSGELIVTGKVMAVGGLKEKLVGASRTQATHIVFPHACYAQFMMVPEFLRNRFTVSFVKSYDDVFLLLFPEHASKVFPDRDASTILTIPAKPVAVASAAPAHTVPEAAAPSVV
ncbi:ATP-dependent protease La [Capsaspora owczarzaki ATCC 30864]|uniref:endopeptidase La n=1 Tax=Capsaspora owczarzaki (strain ATCC 30864) TaxID=595528 RepID=A0A0D2X1Y9_CAPO3|nr:ATP-dependent protease La [Capsaspora owczarzaki ATCC 30864]KJE91639.1 ATP-dependent protease La [Capsaspora owczarzaki ATCC 30864]|eukprot:XP_004349499.2 ATP-dependent protease La [Capsaspora owczarzaki ATCC 30864]